MGRVGGVFAAVPAWLFIVAGMALLTIAVLTPQWLENRRLAWERDLMLAQSETLDQQVKRYEHFLAAIEYGDPAVMRRLALAQLRMRPDDMSLLEAPAGPVEEARDPEASDLAESAALEDWLAVPPPQVGQDYAPYSVTQTRLTRLATGRHRLVLVVAAATCLIAGLLPQRERD